MSEFKLLIITKHLFKLSGYNNHLHGLIFELKERMNSRQDRPVIVCIQVSEEKSIITGGGRVKILCECCEVCVELVRFEAHI